MSVTVVTGFAPAARAEYGDRALQTFDRHWPKGIKQYCYIDSERFEPCYRAVLMHARLCRGLHEFVQRHKDNPEANGRKQNALWRHRDHGKPYSFRFDAVRFSRQLFYPDHLANVLLLDGDILVWLDGDVISTADVPAGLVERLLGDHDVVYLGRKHAHSEIGFWAVRLSELTRQFLTALADTYRTDDVFNLAEWHSAFVWDHHRRAFEAQGMRAKSLTDERHPMARRHPWFTVPPLAECTDHLKGRRKEMGRSPERRRSE